MKMKPYSKAGQMRRLRIRKQKQEQTRRVIKLFDAAIKEHQ